MSRFASVLSKEFLGIQAIIECGFTLKRVRDMIKTYSQMYRTDKYSQHSRSFGQTDQMIELRCEYLPVQLLLRVRVPLLDIQAAIEFGFTLKRVRDMIRTNNQKQCTVQISTQNTAQSFG